LANGTCGDQLKQNFMDREKVESGITFTQTVSMTLAK
jgi:hypothetical protein